MSQVDFRTDINHIGKIHIERVATLPAHTGA